MGWGALSLLTLVVVVGAATQRLTGVGFALVSSPFFVLLLGPSQGVLLANLLSLVTNAVVIALTWRGVEVRRLLLLTVPAVLMIIPGAWVVRYLPPPVLLVLVGSVAVAALLTTAFVHQARVLRGPTGAVVAGALSGFMNVTAGIGGPGVILYAVSSGWAHASFVATIQPYFALVNAASLAAKGLPEIPAGTLLLLLAALGGGSLAGELLSGRVSVDVARKFTMALAVAGAAATVVKGVLTW